jgi:hypothetical protein
MGGADGAQVRVAAAVGRVARRMRARIALHGTERALWALGYVILGLVGAWRMGRIDRGILLALSAAGTLVALAAVLWRARPVSPSIAAAAADRALGLSDRMTSAVAFLADPAPTPLMRLAIDDGARVGATIDPPAVVTMDVPPSGRMLPFLLVAIVLVAIVRIPPPVIAAPAVAMKPRLVVEEDALAAEREQLRKLRDEKKGKDPELAELAQELDKVLEQIDQQQLSRAEAFQKLATLEAKISAERAQLPEPPKKELAALQKALASSKATKDVAKALEKDDLASAKQELEKLAAAAEERAKEEQPKKEEEEAQRELSRALDKASKALDEARKKQEQERDQQIEKLKEEERRLKKQQQEHPEDQDNERKLQRNQRELERLEREKQAQQEQRRQLERLSRDLQKAAEQLRSKMSPEAMRKAAEQLGKMEDEIRKLGSSAQQMMQIGELKEVLRRAGRVEQGNGSQGKGQQGQGQAQQKGKGQKGQGQGDGQGDERAQRMAEFDERAGGQPNALLLGGDDPGQGSVMLPLPMGQGQDPGGGGQDPGDQKGNGKGDPDKPGDGIGSEHDPNLFGDKTRGKQAGKLIRAHGQAGAGPSRSQTILGAAERGFSSKDYGKVYKDYSAVLEEVMSQEGVPPGYRYYVKRYFQLIRPRE